jgi:pimeloyl-ACP methyl ester carboxylesterase
MARDAHPPIGQFIGQPGARLHYVQRGQGSDIVYIHGAAVNLREVLAGPIDVLAANHRVTAFDRPGHGHSDADLRHASPADQAAKIRAVVVQLGLVTPTIVGHSLGGAVALAYGAAFPSEISGVVLIAPLSNPVWGPGQVGLGIRVVPGAGWLLSRSLLALWDPLMMRAAPWHMFAPQKPTPRYLAEFPLALPSLPLAMQADGADFIQATTALQRMRPDFDRYPAPVHIVVGDKDLVLKPSRHGERLAGQLSDARLTVLKGLGHMAHHFAPEAVLGAIEDVVSRVTPLAPAELSAQQAKAPEPVG